MLIRRKITQVCLLTTLCAGLLSANVVHSYDGDVDYSAPYVTLDPETGKLITVDPKQEQAASQQQPQQHTASATDSGTTSSATGEAAAPDNSTIAGTDAEQQAVSGPAVIAAIAGIVLIAVIVALTRKKRGPDTGSVSS